MDDGIEIWQRFCSSLCPTQHESFEMCMAARIVSAFSCLVPCFRWSSWKVSTFLPRPKQRPRVEIPSPTFCFTDEFTAHHHEEKTRRAMAISLEPADGCMMGLYYHVHVDYSNPRRSVNQPVENCSNERLKNWFYCTKESASRLVVLQLERWAANFTGWTSTAPYGSNFAGDMQRERASLDPKIVHFNWMAHMDGSHMHHMLTSFKNAVQPGSVHVIRVIPNKTHRALTKIQVVSICFHMFPCCKGYCPYWSEVNWSESSPKESGNLSLPLQCRPIWCRKPQTFWMGSPTRESWHQHAAFSVGSGSPTIVFKVKKEINVYKRLHKSLAQQHPCLVVSCTSYHVILTIQTTTVTRSLIYWSHMTHRDPSSHYPPRSRGDRWVSMCRSLVHRKNRTNSSLTVDPYGSIWGNWKQKSRKRHLKHVKNMWKTCENSGKIHCRRN